MTFEEIQKKIEGMLSIQLELQRAQLEFKSSLPKLRDDISELRASVVDLKDVSQRHERRMEQLIGYSITGESDRLDTLQRLQNHRTSSH